MTYRGYGTVEGSVYVGEVVAASKREALAKLQEKIDGFTFCYHCSANCEDPEFVVRRVEEVT